MCFNWYRPAEGDCVPYPNVYNQFLQLSSHAGNTLQHGSYMTAVNLLSFKSVKAYSFVLFLTMLVVQLKRAAAVSRQHVAKKAHPTVPQVGEWDTNSPCPWEIRRVENQMVHCSDLHGANRMDMITPTSDDRPTSAPSCPIPASPATELSSPSCSDINRGDLNSLLPRLAFNLTPAQVGSTCPDHQPL